MSREARWGSPTNDTGAVRRPHVADNSLGGQLALEAGAAGRASTVTALSPAGFWRRRGEVLYGRAIFKIMQAEGG